MPRYRSPWLLFWVLGGVVLPSIGHAQRQSDGALTLELLERIEQLEAEVRQIRGELEIQRHLIELLEQERTPTGYIAPLAAPPVPDRSAGTYGQPVPAQPSTALVPPPASPDRTPAAQPAPNVPVGSEQAEFDAALGELREGRYQEAAMGFQRFLSAYPTGRLAGDAQYWLGESYYVRQDYDAAKEAFINMGLHYPQSARLPDALLKLGYIYGEQGDAARAREVLQKLMQVYPNTQAANLAERRLQSLR